MLSASRDDPTGRALRTVCQLKVDAAIERLLTAATMDEVSALQGEVRALRAVLALQQATQVPHMPAV